MLEKTIGLLHTPVGLALTLRHLTQDRPDLLRSGRRPSFVPFAHGAVSPSYPLDDRLRIAAP